MLIHGNNIFANMYLQNVFVQDMEEEKIIGS